MRRAGLLSLVAGALAALGSTASAQTVTLGPITAQLFYKNSGTLSPDLIDRSEEFVGWNTVIGEGDAEEPADDLLVSVTISSTDETFLQQKLELWTTDESGTEVGRREFEGVLLPYQGNVSNPLWLNDVGCAGPLTFHARLGDETRTASLSLRCGE